ncbi:hypothetical protein CJ739_1884 [Mariniflexile rhizosphaerae]|uniref:hypothetical protein n=1 Tax=unclassified Mariniflexile TaxID=2643887 RepID=UPI000CBF06D8|nr:hypothetical protein [Mariniflexile sp. TRM1-10]AXP80969.1 hypothetical protein CJ739_1884 [Mariniflexile sp. TRM1-10]PLB19953.1 MAG: putative membrane protein [Flavobacteriaceae bacterium FS1-H7996/R]
MPKKLVLVCLLNFFIAAVFGLLLRYAFVQPMSLNYRFLTHAHSHVAMLGWVYLMLFTLIVHYFIPDKKPIYNRLFWVTEFAVVGMLFSFPFQGYAAVSIAFSTLHIFCSYYFAYLIFKHHKTKNKVTSRLLKWALAFMLLSTIGVWCLGPAVVMLGQASAFYQIAIQFFLHFQFNGWFLLAVIAVFFHKLQLQDSKEFRLFFKFLIIATILTFALPVNWFAPHPVLVWINGIGVICQLFALYYFIIIIKPALKAFIKTQASVTKFMYDFALVCFVLKMLLQSASLIPEVSNVAYQHRNFVIGFIHLSMLGVISGFLFAFLLQNSLIKHSKTLTFGMYAFIFGFVLTELILLIQGGFFYFGIGLLPNYYLILFLCSILLPLGIGCFIINIINTRKNVAETT